MQAGWPMAHGGGINPSYTGMLAAQEVGRSGLIAGRTLWDVWPMACEAGEQSPSTTHLIAGGMAGPDPAVDSLQKSGFPSPCPDQPTPRG